MSERFSGKELLAPLESDFEFHRAEVWGRGIREWFIARSDLINTQWAKIHSVGFWHGATRTYRYWEFEEKPEHIAHVQGLRHYACLLMEAKKS